MRSASGTNLVVTKLTISGLLALVTVAGCGPVAATTQPSLAGETIQVVATTGMVADAVEHVGAGRVEVEGLMGPGIDPHLYKASEGDLRRLERADVIFYSGLHLEAKLADVLERIGDQRPTRAIAAAIPSSRLLSPAEFEGQHDPHVWFDVELWSVAVADVRDALVELDPGSADLYRDNADAYLAELEELDAYVAAQAARVPRERRVVITAHDAFNYFGKAYGFEVRGLQGISTASEAGAGDVQGLARFIAEREIPALFVESSVSSRTIDAVREAVRARGFDVEIGGSLFSDAMGDEGTPEGSYVGMVRHNVDTIVEGLLG
ncbi:MAG: zinc ABC transporter substrate-binding protein [Actinobacteria bacterium]|nr:zinc ABC transporter substrate-binding protein [Actinomycetota bacterium]